MTQEIRLGEPTTGEAELDAVRDVLASGWLAGQGPATGELESAFAELVGAPHALALSNCTSALHLALLSLGVDAGDEVIVADYTYPATAHAVLFCGATPRFADVYGDTGLVDPSAVEALVNQRTVGVIAVDQYGQPAHLEEVRAVTDRHGLFLIEDAAPSAGATYHGLPTGHPDLADIATFSLHGRKGITSGEGGILVTGDPGVAAFVETRRAFGVEPALARAGSGDLPVPRFTELGWNYKLSDIACAIARAQLDRLGDIVAARGRAAAMYEEMLGSCQLFALPVALPDRTHPWQTYALTLDESVDRGRLARLLRQDGIGCNIGAFSCHLQPVYETEDTCPVAADLFRRQFSIPMHANLTEDQVGRVAASLLANVEEATRPHT